MNRNGLTRIGCISDTHISAEFESDSLFPRQMRALGDEAGRALYEQLREAIADAYHTMRDWLRHSGSHVAIHLGDVTGGYQEQGIQHPRVQRLAGMVADELRRSALCARFALGNHDTGYTHAGALPGSGISTRSIDACREIFGELYWVVERPEALLVGVCSPLASYTGPDPWIQRWKKRQEQFLADAMRMYSDRPWILFAHDPRTLLHLAPIIAPHLERLVRFVYGDKHAPWFGSVMQRFATALNNRPYIPLSTERRVAFASLARSDLCPSTAPLWWHGYGALQLDVTPLECRSRVITKPPPQWVHSLPTASPARCVWWMIRPRPVALLRQQ